MQISQQFLKLLLTTKSSIYKSNLVTIYATPERKISDITDHLSKEMSTAQNIQDKENKKAVITSLSNLRKAITILPQNKNGYIFLSGEIESCI
jgi:peptide subunit release factor 1 (eRF1)